MVKAKRFIRSQGDFDSACFLYSLVNAVQCLSGKVLSGAAWGRLVSRVYDPRDFLTNGRGTTNIDDHFALIEELGSKYTATLDPKGNYTVSLQNDLDSASKLSLLKKRSVLVAANNNHWFCLLDSCDGNVYIACSEVWQKKNLSEYYESSSPKLFRTYNKIDSAATLMPTLTCTLLIKAK